jgi:hypothetical protein
MHILQNQDKMDSGRQIQMWVWVQVRKDMRTHIRMRVQLGVLICVRDEVVGLVVAGKGIVGKKERQNCTLETVVV